MQMNSLNAPNEIFFFIQTFLNKYGIKINWNYLTVAGKVSDVFIFRQGHVSENKLVYYFHYHKLIFN